MMECDYCGKEFERRASTQRFCKEQCGRNWRYHGGPKKTFETPETGRAQIHSAEWPKGYGIYHWGEIRETAEYGSWPADAVFQDINDPSIKFKVQSNSQTIYDPEIVSPQTLVRVESE